MSEVLEKVIRTVVGVVTSDKRDMTRTIEVERTIKHPTYGKIQRKKTKYQVHDPENKSKLGDFIEIVEVRPISKTKTWKLVKVVRQAK